MNVFQNSRSPLECISSAAGGSDGDLLAIKYVRVDRQSPEYVPVYKGIDQNVDITTSTFVFRAAPEPVISLYEFIMTTFVPEKPADTVPSPVDSPENEDGPAGPIETSNSSDKINVSLKLASVQGRSTQPTISRLVYSSAHQCILSTMTSSSRLCRSPLPTFQSRYALILCTLAAGLAVSTCEMSLT